MDHGGGTGGFPYIPYPLCTPFSPQNMQYALKYVQDWDCQQPSALKNL